jgi:biopolymer transport protein ExbD
MSHGGGGDNSTCEPNLVPLLDLVFQLLMFFIMCVNFVSGQTSADVKLSASELAQPLEKSNSERLFLNVKALQTRDGRDWLDKLPARMHPDRFKQKGADDRLKYKAAVLVFGLPPMTMLETRRWLKDTYQDAKAKLKGGETEVKTVIHIRPDADLEYEDYYDLLEAVKVAGYKKMKLHATRVGGGR